MHTHRAKKTGRTVLLTLLLLALTGTVGADELIMRDGSRLVGDVVKRDDGNLQFKTGYAGTIAVKWAEIAEIKTDKAMEFLLSDDTTVQVTRVRNSADAVVIEDENGHSRTLDQAAVASVNPEPWRKGERRKFTGLVNLAFESQRGNTDQDELDWDGSMTLRGRKDRITAFGEYEKDVNNNTTTKKKWKLEGAYNYFVTKKWYTGAFARLEHDKFADLDLRTSVGPLLGYQWFEGPDRNLSTTTGVSYVDEDFITGDDDDYVALPWTVDYDNMLWNTNIQLYHKQVGFWSLESTSDVVWDTWTGLRFPLLMGIVASTEVKVEYDGGAADGAEEYDTTFSVKLGYGW